MKIRTFMDAIRELFLSETLPIALYRRTVCFGTKSSLESRSASALEQDPPVQGPTSISVLRIFSPIRKLARERRPLCSVSSCSEDSARDSAPRTCPPPRPLQNHER